MKYKTNWNRSFLMRISQLIKFNEYKKVIELLENNISLCPEKINKNMTWENETIKAIQQTLMLIIIE